MTGRAVRHLGRRHVSPATVAARAADADAAVRHRRRAVVPFEPGEIVTMYTCGITPYDATHLGHAAAYLAYDVLQRRLRDRGHETRCVRNVTDVDDRSSRKARELGVHYLDLAAAETAKFDDDMVALGCSRAGASPGPPRPSPTSGASSAWCSTAATPTRPAGPCTSTSSTYPQFGEICRLRPGDDARLRRRAGRQRRRPEQARPARLRALAAVAARRAVVGLAVGSRTGPAGTSSARPWPCGSWAPPSTCTAGERT